MFSESDFKAFEERVISAARGIYAENVKAAEESFKREVERLNGEAEQKLNLLKRELITKERYEKQRRMDEIEGELKRRIHERIKAKIEMIRQLCLKTIEENEERIFKGFISSVIKKYKDGTFIVNKKYQLYFKGTNFKIGDVAYAIFIKGRIQVELSAEDFIQSAVQDFLKTVENL